YVRTDAKDITQLRIVGDKIKWLAEFLDIVGECWKSRNGMELSVLYGLLPNQNSILCSPEDLKRDEGVSEQLKDICSEIGLDVRDEMLIEGFSDIAIAEQLEYAVDTIEKS